MFCTVYAGHGGAFRLHHILGNILNIYVGSIYVQYNVYKAQCTCAIECEGSLLCRETTGGVECWEIINDG